MRSIISAAAATFALGSLLSPSVRPHRVVQSKHQPSRFGKGRVRIGQHSGLRKLMRAASRGKVPSDRLFTIEHAMRNALKR